MRHRRFRSEPAPNGIQKDRVRITDSRRPSLTNLFNQAYSNLCIICHLRIRLWCAIPRKGALNTDWRSPCALYAGRVQPSGPRMDETRLHIADRAWRRFTHNKRGIRRREIPSDSTPLASIRNRSDQGSARRKRHRQARRSVISTGGGFQVRRR